MSGPSSLPPAPPGPPTQPPSVRDGTPARILSANGALAQLPRPVTVSGQIISLAPDGTAQIHTDQGDISLQPRGAAVPLTVGQNVEVDLSAGRPPRQATIRPDAATTSTTTASPAPPPTGTSSANAVAPAPAGVSADPDSGSENPQANGNAGAASTNARPPSAVIVDTVVAEVASDAIAAAAENAVAAQVTVIPGDLLRLQPLASGQTLAPPAAAAAAEVVTLPLLPASAVTAAASLAPLGGLQFTPSSPPAGAKALVQPLLQHLGKPSAQPFAPVPGRPLAVAPAFTPATGRAAPASASAVGRPQFQRSTMTTLFPGTSLSPSQIGLGTASASPSPHSPLTTKGALEMTRAPVARPLDIRVATLGPPAVRFTPASPGAAPVGKLAAPPAAPSAPRLSVAAPGILTGTVAGHVAIPGFAPMPVVSVVMPGQATPQLFTVQAAAANLPVGATIGFTPQGDDIADALAETPLLGMPSLQWPSLSMVHDAAAAILPRGDMPMALLLPSPAMPDGLPAAALLFVAALRSGDLAGWLGEKTLDVLRRSGQDDLLARLGADGEALGRIAAPAAGADSWSILPLPLLWEGEVQRMVLRYRRDSGGGGAEQKKRRGTRFVFDMALSRIGNVQLDGLHKPKAATDDDDRLDLIVRTRAALSAPMQAAMRVRYHEALTACHHRGEMLFQYRPEQWLKFAAT